MNGNTRPIRERFDAKVSPEPNTGCWLWTGALSTRGYGSLGVGGSGRTAPAHRISFQLHKGEIPNGMHVLHRCDVRCCVNPEHLFLGTNADNVIDKVAKGRQAKGASISASTLRKLTERDVRAIRERYRAGGISQRKLAAEFGVTQRMVGLIDAGRAHAWVFE